MKNRKNNCNQVIAKSLIFLIFNLFAVSGCNKNPSAANSDIEDVSATIGSTRVNNGASSHEVITPSQKDDRLALPILSKEDVTNSLSWLVEALSLKKSKFNRFKITSYLISEDGRYAIINISNDDETGAGGPFYRYVVANPVAKRIFYPPMDLLHSEDLGYPYIAADFNDNNKLAIAYGYRSIEASVVSLPEAKVLETKELNVFETEQIASELSRMLEHYR